MIRIEGFPSQTLVRLPVDAVGRMAALPLCRSLHVTDIGHYPEARDHFVCRDLGCPNHILIYCLSGRGFCRVGEKRFAVEGGQAALIPAGLAHEYGTEPEQSWRIYWIHFNGADASGLFDRLTDNGERNLIYLPRPDPIIDAFEETIRWSRRGHTNNSLIAMTGACGRLLGLVIDGMRSSAGRARQVEERVRSTIARMRETLRHPLTLEQLATEACLSIAHYCALFKKQTGSSPKQLYSQLRIQLACELLHNTRLDIQEVAEEAGFQDAYYFSRAFKKAMGAPPSLYRKSLETRGQTSIVKSGAVTGWHRTG